MSTVLDIALDKNPDVAALVADKSVGDRIYGAFTIKSMDPQTLSVRIEDMADTASELPEVSDTDEEDAETEDNAEEEGAEGASNTEKPEPPDESIGARMAKKMSASNTGSY